MKRLIYIFLFLPLLLNGQIAENKTYPFKGYAFQGDGTSNYANCGNILSFANGTDTQPFTVYCTFLYVAGDHNCEVGKMSGGNASYGEWYLQQSSNYLYVTLVDNINHAKRYWIVTMTGLSDGDIIRVAITYDGDYTISYNYSINGGVWNYLEDNTYSDVGSYSHMVATSYNLMIGHIFSNEYNDNKNWNIGISDTIPTSADLNAYLTSDFGSINGLLAFWPLSEGSGNKVYDISGNGYNGTVYGFNNWSSEINSYNENYGVTKVKYNGQSIFVPYTIGKTPIYNHSTPVMNSNEKYINYPDTVWNKKYWIK